MSTLEISEEERTYFEVFNKKLNEFELKKPKTYRETVAVTNRISEVGMEFPKELFVLGKTNKTKENANPKNEQPKEEGAAEQDGSNKSDDQAGKEEPKEEIPQPKPKKVYKISNEEAKPENM